MQVIGMLDSPYVRRVVVTALQAGVPFQHRPISIFRHIDEFTAFSPLLKAPSFITDDGVALVESSVILEYMASVSPAVTALMPRTAPAFRAAGVALTVCEKAVQFHYERALRTPDQRSPDWVARITRQLNEGLAALERDIPEQGWIGGALGVADITVACAFGFTQGMIADLVAAADYPRLLAFCDRAEALDAFKAAPPVDGVTAPVG